MKVTRIVADLPASNLGEVKHFYGSVLNLDLLMDLDWVHTYGTPKEMPVQLTVATQGGSGTKLPKVSIEVDNLDEALERAERFGSEIEYGPVEEPWGVRRFFVRDPAGNLLNILQHV